MALNGTLEELAVLDVVQFVNQAHLSGSLLLKSGSEEAQLFYRKGGLVHASLGALSGLEVLIRIVDWTAGTFNFDAGAVTTEESIRMDLHRAVMYALKTRDERKLESEKRQAAEVPPVEKEISPDERLAEAISQLEFVRQAVVFDGDGVLASTARNGAHGDELAPLCKSLAALTSDYPRGRLRRAILDDENGTVLVSCLPRKRWVVVVAERGVALGAVMAGMGRLVAKLETLVLDRQRALVGAV
ncbi:MAG TPA: DUF4388 domain-containing protein [Bryobacteraceae bacterium]|jgi:hypothetical protein